MPWLSIEDDMSGVRRSMLIAALATVLVAWASTIAMASEFPLHSKCSKFEAWAWAIVFAASVTASLYSLLTASAQDSRRELVKISLPLIANLMFLFLYFDFAYMSGHNFLPDTSVDVMMAIAAPLMIALSFRQSQILLKSDAESLEP